VVSFVPCQNRNDLIMIDHYDFVILDIIQNFKKNNKNQLIKLSQLEANFWVKVERELAHQNQSAQLGERISKLYLEGFIINKPNLGYTITRKGRELLLTARPIQH
jgi:predicted transcriptional regulator